ncbi:UDP-N-acetylglucosamine pyrophosphorylase [Eubacterium ruminantium]|uniref:UDP-N-acetylglucosamine pyrophosphorylase n=1 Tax=Eubacterium ruminantium TaxID=42322 RepID=UPI00156898F1|nr:UDP-N-acetylglucosamine pyrophosphorylase [Eubacterium ruminantium]
MSNNELLMIKNLYDLDHTEAKGLMEKFDYPWEVLPEIGSFIKKLGEKIDKTCPDEYIKRGDSVWIHKSAKVWDSAFFGDNVIIGADTEVRQCAFIRGNALVGKGCVVGNSTELKNVILFDNVQVPHYNYVGDSILGYKSHMGAGSITSNVKSDKTLVTVKGNDDLSDIHIETGLKKFGAMIGDHVEVGCNSVLNPGTVIGRNTNIYPLSPIRGFIPEKSIVKTGNVIITKNEE